MSDLINMTDLHHLCKLSMLDEKSMDAHQIQEDISNIITHLTQLDTVNTDDVTPLSHPLDVAQPLREDQVTEPNQRETLQTLSADTQHGLYLVPAFIET